MQAGDPPCQSGVLVDKGIPGMDPLRATNDPSSGSIPGWAQAVLDPPNACVTTQEQAVPHLPFLLLLLEFLLLPPEFLLFLLLS